MKTLSDILHASLVRRIAWLRNALTGSDIRDVVRRRLLLSMHNAVLMEIGGMAAPPPRARPAFTVALPVRRRGAG